MCCASPKRCTGREQEVGTLLAAFVAFTKRMEPTPGDFASRGQAATACYNRSVAEKRMIPEEGHEEFL